MNLDLSFKLLLLVILAGLITAFVTPSPAPAAASDYGSAGPAFASTRVTALPLP